MNSREIVQIWHDQVDLIQDVMEGHGLVAQRSDDGDVLAISAIWPDEESSISATRLTIRVGENELVQSEMTRGSSSTPLVEDFSIRESEFYHWLRIVLDFIDRTADD